MHTTIQEALNLLLQASLIGLANAYFDTYRDKHKDKLDVYLNYTLFSVLTPPRGVTREPKPNPINLVNLGK